MRLLKFGAGVAAVIALVVIASPAAAQTNVFHDDWSGFATGSALTSNGYQCFNAPTTVHGGRTCGGMNGHFVSVNAFGQKYVTNTQPLGGFGDGASHLLTPFVADAATGGPTSTQIGISSGVVSLEHEITISSAGKNVMSTWTHGGQTDWAGSNEMQFTTFNNYPGSTPTSIGWFSIGSFATSVSFGELGAPDNLSGHRFVASYTVRPSTGYQVDIKITDIDSTGTTSTGFTGSVYFPTGANVFWSAWGVNRWAWFNCCDPVQGVTSYRMSPQLDIVPGDHDLDGDVAVSDFSRVVGNWTGPVGLAGGKIWGDGDFSPKGDGDVDVSDFGAIVGNWTGGAAGNQVDTGNADLIYNPSTGGLTLDASAGPSGVITSYVLQCSGCFINTPGNSAFSNFSFVSNATLTTEADFSLVGFTGTHFLGNLLPPGLTLAALEAMLDVDASYSGALGFGGTLDLVIPEPATLALLGLGGLVLLRRRR